MRSDCSTRFPDGSGEAEWAFSERPAPQEGGAPAGLGAEALPVERSLSYQDHWGLAKLKQKP